MPSPSDTGPESHLRPFLLVLAPVAEHLSTVRIFKIFRAAEWQLFHQAGVFAGSADDRRDGFIHLSSDEQLPGTLEKHFRGETGLVVAEILVGNDPMLRWEVSRDGARFPHLYRPLTLADLGASAPGSSVGVMPTP